MIKKKDGHIYVRSMVGFSQVLGDHYGDVIVCEDVGLSFASIPPEISDRLFLPVEGNGLIGKPVFHKYKSDNMDDVLGVVIDSYIHDDNSVEALLAFDKTKYESIEKDMDMLEMSIGYWVDTRDQTYTPYGINLSAKR